MAFEQLLRRTQGRNYTLPAPHFVSVMQEYAWGAITKSQARVMFEEVLATKNFGNAVVIGGDDALDIIDLLQALDDIDALPGKTAEEKMVRKIFTVQSVYRVMSLYASGIFTGYKTRVEVVARLRQIVPTWRD